MLLGSLGLTRQLGHLDGTTCPHPSRKYQLTVFDLSGVHQVVIQYCTCNPANTAARREQLLDEMWFPATIVRPNTVFTFNLLDFFHQLQTQNKTNLYDFYNTIVLLSNSAGLSPQVVCPPFPLSTCRMALICLISIDITRSRSCTVCGSTSNS